MTLLLLCCSNCCNLIIIFFLLVSQRGGLERLSITTVRKRTQTESRMNCADRLNSGSGNGSSMSYVLTGEKLIGISTFMGADLAVGAEMAQEHF